MGVEKDTNNWGKEHRRDAAADGSRLFLGRKKKKSARRKSLIEELVQKGRPSLVRCPSEIPSEMPRACRGNDKAGSHCRQGTEAVLTARKKTFEARA